MARRVALFKSVVFSFACLLSSICGGNKANSAVVSYQTSVANGAGIGTLRLFDGSLGVLQRVALHASLNAEVTVVGSTSCNPIHTFGCLISYGGSLTGITFFSRGAIFLNLFSTSQNSSQCFFPAGIAGECNFPLAISNSAFSQATDAVTLAAFVGVGSFDIPFSLGVTAFSPYTSFRFSPENIGMVRVSYEYLERNVPEPSSLHLIGLALVLLAGTRLFSDGATQQKRLNASLKVPT